MKVLIKFQPKTRRVLRDLCTVIIIGLLSVGPWRPAFADAPYPGALRSHTHSGPADGGKITNLDLNASGKYSVGRSTLTDSTLVVGGNTIVGGTGSSVSFSTANALTSNIQDNILRNGDFSAWFDNASGTSMLCTGFTGLYFGPVLWTGNYNASCSDTNNQNRLTSQQDPEGGKYAYDMKLANILSTSRIWVEQSVPNYYDYIGKTVSLRVRIKTTSPNVLASIYDGVSYSSSNVHSGSGNYEALTLTSTISVSATQLSVRIGAMGGQPTGLDAYIASAMLVVGSTPTAFVADSIQKQAIGGDFYVTPSTGEWGEYRSSACANASIGTTALYRDMAAVPLTIGEWDIQGSLYLDSSNGTRAQNCLIVLSTAPGNIFGDVSIGQNRFDFNMAGSSITFLPLIVPNYRVTPTALTNYYLKVNCSYTGTTPIVYGYIRGRRIR